MKIWSGQGPRKALICGKACHSTRRIRNKPVKSLYVFFLIADSWIVDIALIGHKH
jgi:hypothetical protein